MNDSSKEMEIPHIDLNVLGYFEDGDHVALALEMDLRGYGDSPEAALEDLHELVQMQLSFALSNTGSLDSAFMPAEDKYFSIYIKTKADALKSEIDSLRGQIAELQLGQITELQHNFFTAGISVPAANVIEGMKGDYSANHA